MPEQILTPGTESLESVEHPVYYLPMVVSLLLRKHFSRSSQLPKSLENLVYSDDPALTKLHILLRDETSTINWASRPAMIIRRNSFKTSRMGFGEGRLSYFGSYNAASHNVLYVGSCTVLCCSHREAQSTQLALEAHQYLMRFQHQIRQGLRLMRLGVGEIGQAGILKEDRQVYATPFTLMFGYDRPFSVFPVSPPIRFINVKQELK